MFTFFRFRLIHLIEPDLYSTAYSIQMVPGLVVTQPVCPRQDSVSCNLPSFKREFFDSQQVV
jgi:hypothetical protein